MENLDKKISEARKALEQLEKKRKSVSNQDATYRKVLKTDKETNVDKVPLQVLVISSDDDDGDDDGDKRDDTADEESPFFLPCHPSPKATEKDATQVKREPGPVHEISCGDEDDDEDIADSPNVSTCLPAAVSFTTSTEEDDKDLSVDKENDPVLERPIRGFTASRLLDIIVGKQVSKANICKRVPRAVRSHGAYVVDTVALGCSDILCFGDDNGSWGGHTKPRRKYKVELSEQTGVLSCREYHSKSEDAPDPEDVYTLYRNYFRHSHTPEFRKVIATVYDWNGDMLPLAVVQYVFEGGIEVPIKLAKHGNDKRQDAEPYMRTSRPVLKKIQEKCKIKSCKKAVDECCEEGGGSIGCTSMADVPRNRKQAYNQNMQKKEVHSAKRHDFYDVLELLNKGTFVRDFGFAKSSKSQRTQPRSFQATQFQLNDLSRICLSQKFSTVLSIDATFNCGPFYVTLTSYKHTMFVNKADKHPVMLGPSILHTTKEFEDYHYLSSQLKSHCEGFGSLQAYGTDGETNLINAFICELPESIHLRCKIHLADNIEAKLVSLSFRTEARKGIMNSIFGRRSGETREKGLADACSADEFDTLLHEVRTEWNEVEATQHSGDPKFHVWFKQHLSQVMKENVISPIRQIAGLGSPPELYTQNVAECCNRVIKEDAGKKMGWVDFCHSIEETAERQERDVKKAVHQMGEYRLAPEFKHLEVKAEKWLKMTTPQREAYFKRCFSHPLDKLGKSDDVEEDVTVEEGGELSVSYENCGITTVSRSNLKHMWCFAATILNQDQGVLTVPWESTGSQKMVFDGEGKPPCNVVVAGDMVRCSCPKYKSAMICSHSLAVAEHELCLQEFLSLVRKRKKLPDPHQLIVENLSTSAGQKPAARRKGKANASRPPLMTITGRSTATKSSASNSSASFDAAAALMELSGRRPASNDSDDNRFSLKQLEGTQVRMCYGCGKPIRVPPQVPDPPHDYCIVNREYRMYKAADGSWKISNDAQNCHYHLSTACVKRKHKEFERGMFQIPAAMRPKLSAVHWSWLEKEFYMFL